MDRTEFGSLVIHLRTTAGMRQRMDFAREVNILLSSSSDVEYVNRLVKSKKSHKGNQQIASDRLTVVKRIIAEIERGDRVIVPPAILSCMADVLRLSSMERREFFYAASGLPDITMIRHLDVEKTRARAVATYEKLVKIVDDLRIPAFLLDCYGDILMANPHIKEFLKVPDEYLLSPQKLKDDPLAYSMMRFVYSKPSTFRQVMDEDDERDWIAYALDNMKTFRSITLRYRHRPEFTSRFEALYSADYPEFKDFWRMVEDRDYNTEYETDYLSDAFRASIRHVDFGRLEYTVISSVSLTYCGELYLIVYMPVDDAARKAFKRIEEGVRKKGIPSLRSFFPPWPR